MPCVFSFEKTCDRLTGILRAPWALFSIPVLVIIWRLILSSPADPDLFARVGMGRLVEKLGAVPLQDPFAFTEKLPMWIDHEWLSGVVFYQIGSYLGDFGLIFLKLALAAWTCVLVVRASQLYAPRSPGQLVWLTICLLDASFLWGSTIRAQVFTYLFLAIMYLGYVEYQVKGRIRYLLLMPIISVAWINMHGGYALGMLTLGILTCISYLERRPWKMLFATTILCSVALFTTPYGFKVFSQYLLHALTMQRPTISEWAPLWSDKDSFLISTALLGSILLGLISRKQTGPRFIGGLAVILFSAYCGYRHIRFSGFFSITAAVFGAGYFGSALDTIKSALGNRSLVMERSLSLAVSIMVTLCGASVANALIKPSSWRLYYSSYPTQALQWLRASGISGPQRLLVDFNNGSFALWRLHPNFLISMDGRYEEVYPDDTVRDASNALLPNTPEGRDALKIINPTHILWRTTADLEQLKSSLPSEWYEIYRDSEYTIVTRTPDHPKPAMPPAQMITIWDPMF